MIKSKTKYFIIDFDSTFVKSEGLEELAEIALQKNSKKKILMDKISSITRQSMEGKMPFDKSLSQRLQYIKANRSHIEKTATILKKKISSSILRNKSFFKTYKDHIYIISGGFKEFILPVIKPFGISDDHVFANTFLFDKNGNVIGYDTSNPLSQEDGKAKLVKSLKLDGELFVIGDGYTDYKLKELGLVKKFIAFTENIERDVVVKKADTIAPSFDEFLYVNKFPRSLSYPKNRIKVLLLENVHPKASELFMKEGYQVETLAGSLSENELIAKIKDISIIGTGSRTNINKKVIDHAERLLAIARFGIGVNNIDISNCSKKGIAVFNAPYSNTRSVVELVLGEILLLARRALEKSTKMQSGKWDKSATNCFEVRGKNLGIIGYGKIGSQLSVLAESLGMNVYFYDIEDKLALGNAKQCESLKKLLTIADIVSLHIDGRKENTNFIGEKEFKLLKQGALFINSSRGNVVDIEALAKNIKSGKIKGAGVDVFPQEPKNNDEPFYSILQNLENVILTPHIGGRSEEAQFDMAKFVPEKIITFINSGNTLLCLSLPTIQLPLQRDAHRLLHLHRNVPGILAQINNIFAEHNINILGQYLKTNEEIGYVITDVDKDYDKKVLDILKKIPDTIRFRVLY